MVLSVPSSTELLGCPTSFLAGMRFPHGPEGFENVVWVFLRGYILLNYRQEELGLTNSTTTRSNE